MATTTTLVLTVIGRDRPGLVEAISAKALAHGANWEESRMARLAGHFAGILLVRVDDAKRDALEADLRGLEPEGLQIVVERSGGDPVREERQRLRLEVVGNDRPGIVAEISSALARKGINLDELKTECVEAPMSGGQQFTLSAALYCPEASTGEHLRDLLERFADELMVDLVPEPS
jgi:glycine cleavage system regulatory protein